MAVINPPAWPIEKGEKNVLNILLNAFRIAINGALSVFGMVDGFVDEFEDETGIDNTASLNEEYDASGDFYSPAGVGGIDSNVVLLLHGDGADGSTTITDSSDSGKTPASVAGNTQIDTAQKKFGTASILFDGSGDYIQYADHADWDFGTGDFTIDLWVRFNSLGIGHGFLHRDNGGGNGYQLVWSSGSGGQLIFQAGNSSLISRAWSPSTGTDYHISITRSGTDMRLFIDGVQQGATVTNSTDLTYTSALEIGVGDSGRYLDGWIDELRISKGVGRYTASFTPETSAYSAPVAQDMTLISEAQTAEEEAKTARIVVFEEDVDAVTLNTDLKAYVSRDDGTTWTQITLSDEGDYGSGKRILTGQVGITAQPSGTDMRYKLETDNAKDLKVHGVALTWD